MRTIQHGGSPRAPPARGHVISVFCGHLRDINLSISVFRLGRGAQQGIHHAPQHPRLIGRAAQPRRPADRRHHVSSCLGKSWAHTGLRRGDRATSRPVHIAQSAPPRSANSNRVKSITSFKGPISQTSTTNRPASSLEPRRSGTVTPRCHPARIVRSRWRRLTCGHDERVTQRATASASARRWIALSPMRGRFACSFCSTSSSVASPRQTSSAAATVAERPWPNAQ